MLEPVERSTDVEIGEGDLGVVQCPDVVPVGRFQLGRQALHPVALRRVGVTVRLADRRDLRRLEALESGGLLVVVERGVEEDPVEGYPIVLDLIGSDRPGIVHKISEALAARNVNVDELNTECDGAPWSGDTLFKATARLRAPKDLDLDQLREGLEAIAGDLMVDITIGEAE